MYRLPDHKIIGGGGLQPPLYTYRPIIFVPHNISTCFVILVNEEEFIAIMTGDT